MLTRVSKADCTCSPGSETLTGPDSHILALFANSLTAVANGTHLAFVGYENQLSIFGKHPNQNTKLSISCTWNPRVNNPLQQHSILSKDKRRM
jgi:hypothetical protein